MPQHIAWDVYGGNWPNQPCLHKVGSNLYLAVGVYSAIELSVYKSTDGGLTWTELDAANRPFVIEGPAFAVERIGSKLWFAYVQFFNSEIILQPFDLTTDTWGALTTGGPAAYGYLGVEPPIFLAARSTGELVVLFFMSSGALSGTNRFDTVTETWVGVNQPVIGSGGFYTQGAIADVDNRVHLLVNNSTQLNHRALLATDAYGAAQKIVDRPWRMQDRMVYHMMIHSGELFIACCHSLPDFSNNLELISVQVTLEDIPVITSHVVDFRIPPDASNVNAVPNVVRLVEIGGTLYAFWIKLDWSNDSSFCVWCRHNADNTWTEPLMVWVAPQYETLSQMYAAPLDAESVGLVFVLSFQDELESPHTTDVVYMPFTPPVIEEPAAVLSNVAY